MLLVGHLARTVLEIVDDKASCPANYVDCESFVSHSLIDYAITHILKDTTNATFERIPKIRPKFRTRDASIFLQNSIQKFVTR